MSGAIADLEHQGYRFRLEGDQVMVSGPDVLTEPDALVGIRQRKTEILSELRLQAFVELVRAAGASKHQILLHPEEIAAELDDTDIQALLNIDCAERQNWAELLAYRLCMARLNQLRKHKEKLHCLKLRLRSSDSQFRFFADIQNLQCSLEPYAGAVD